MGPSPLDLQNGKCFRRMNRVGASPCRANYSNRGWREKIFENMFFEAERRRKLFQMKVLGAAIDSDKFSSKSELSSRFFGRLKFSALFE